MILGSHDHHDVQGLLHGSHSCSQLGRGRSRCGHLLRTLAHNWWNYTRNASYRMTASCHLTQSLNWSEGVGKRGLGGGEGISVSE